MLWSKEQELELTRLFTTLFEGAYLSHRTIGASMVPPIGRNAVIGKVHRLKLTRDPLLPCRGVDNRIVDPIQKLSENQVSSVPKAYGRAGGSKPPLPLGGATGAGECVGPPAATAITILEASDHTCRFPIGHVGYENFHLCGVEVEKAPYCPFHSRLCFVPLKDRKRHVASFDRFFRAS